MSRMQRKNNRRKKSKRFTLSFLIITLLIASGSFVFVMLNSTDAIFGFTFDKSSLFFSKKEYNPTEDNIPVEPISLNNFLFVGDSYTVLLEDTIKDNTTDSIVRAKSGVQPSYWNENFNLLPYESEINGVVLLVGVNGVTFDDNLPSKKQLIDSLVQKYPNRTIYVQKVFNVGKNFTNADPVVFNNAINEHNEEIQSYCENYSNVVFIDSTKDLITEDGYLKYTNDGLHISSEYQQTFFNNILDAINSNN